MTTPRFFRVLLSPPSAITIPTIGLDYATFLPVRESVFTPGIRLLPPNRRIFSSGFDSLAYPATPPRSLKFGPLYAPNPPASTTLQPVSQCAAATKRTLRRHFILITTDGVIAHFYVLVKAPVQKFGPCLFQLTSLFTLTSLFSFISNVLCWRRKPKEQKLYYCPNM